MFLTRFLPLVVYLFSALIYPLANGSDEARPNIVFIFIDDQGYYDLGCYGATEIETPRIDAMAEEGIRFTEGGNRGR